jgi:hypothetical protein
MGEYNESWRKQRDTLGDTGKRRLEEEVVILWSRYGDMVVKLM